MAITFDPAKRDWTLRERGLDFLMAASVFEGRVYDRVDTRRDYGKTRIMTVGLIGSRMIVVGWTPRGADRHVFSMRKANGREQAKYADRLR